MHPNEMLVRRFHEARARDDREAIRACLHPDVACHDPYPEPHGGDLRGADAVFAQIFDAAGELTGGSGRLVPHDVLANDEHAVALVDWSASLHGLTMQGREVAVFHVDAGLGCWLGSSVAHQALGRLEAKLSVASRRSHSHARIGRFRPLWPSLGRPNRAQDDSRNDSQPGLAGEPVPPHAAARR